MTSASYTVVEVSRILGVAPNRVRELARKSLVSPRPDAQGEAHFTFQDLVLLKTAAHLLEDHVPLRRIKQALEAVARDLPQDRPLSAIRVRSEGRRIVADGESTTWEPATGQLLFDFGQRVVPAPIRTLPTVTRGPDDLPSADRFSADEWYMLGRDLEESSGGEARDAYRRALELDPHHLGARNNLGRLLHDTERLDAAEAQYRLAEMLGPSAAVAFNLGVLLEDRARPGEAETAYRRALALEPEHTGALLNLAKLFERQGRKAEALRALKAYSEAVKDAND